MRFCREVEMECAPRRQTAARLGAWVTLSRVGRIHHCLARREKHSSMGDCLCSQDRQMDVGRRVCRAEPPFKPLTWAGYGSLRNLKTRRRYRPQCVAITASSIRLTPGWSSGIGRGLVGTKNCGFNCHSQSNPFGILVAGYRLLTGEGG